MDTKVEKLASIAADNEDPVVQPQGPLDCLSPEPESAARLIVKPTSVKSGRRHFYLYDVEFGGELIVTDSADPECDLARALLARDVTGRVAILDGKTGKHRTTVNIEKAALRTVRDTEREGPRFVQWKALKPGDGPPGSGKRGQS